MTPGGDSHKKGKETPGFNPGKPQHGFGGPAEKSQQEKGGRLGGIVRPRLAQTKTPPIVWKKKGTTYENPQAKNPCEGPSGGKKPYAGHPPKRARTSKRPWGGGAVPRCQLTGGERRQAKGKGNNQREGGEKYIDVEPYPVQKHNWKKPKKCTRPNEKTKKKAGKITRRRPDEGNGRTGGPVEQKNNWDWVGTSVD